VTAKDPLFPLPQYKADSSASLQNDIKTQFHRRGNTVANDDEVFILTAKFISRFAANLSQKFRGRPPSFRLPGEEFELSANHARARSRHLSG
jgi:hypothetical protein